MKDTFDFDTFLNMDINFRKLSLFWFSEADLGLVVADWGLQVEDELLCGQLFCIDLAHFGLQLVYFLDFWADGGLENVFELSGLISDIILQNQRRVLQIGDLIFDNFSQIDQIVSILIDSISQKSTHLLHKKKDT